MPILFVTDPGSCLNPIRLRLLRTQSHPLWLLHAAASILAGAVTLWQRCQHRAGSTARLLLEGATEYCQMTASPHDVPAARQLPSELHERAVTVLLLSPAANLRAITMAGV